MTMIKRLLSCIAIIIISSCTAQILDVYPKGQDFYEGGLVNFYKESHDYLIKNNIKKMWRSGNISAKIYYYKRCCR